MSDNSRVRGMGPQVVILLGSAVFPPRSIDTTLTLALTHEIW